MIFTKQQGDLQHSINKMAIPVFVVDQEEDGEFRVVALNTAHTMVTGLNLEAVVQKTPHMILPDEKDAEFLNNKYRSCIQKRKPVVYSSQMTYRDVVKDIRTILHPISIEGAAPKRLVGQVTITAPALKDTMKDALGDQGALAQPDIQAIEAILDDIRLRQTICSKDLMLLGVLMRNRSMSLSEVARLAANFDQAQKGRRTTAAEFSKPPRAALSLVN